ncbi:MAG: hypothetical protein KIT45_13735 [Fimbriimonadia bacterium]|nr:hypothetical protein [Fimbriimonadia bacterium]
MNRCHLYRDHLKAWLDQELRGWRRWQVGRHLRQCLSCQRECENLRAVSARLQALDAPVTPESLRDRIMLAVAQEIQTAPVPERNPVPLKWAWGLPALLAIGFAFTGLFFLSSMKMGANGTKSAIHFAMEPQREIAHKDLAASAPDSMLSKALNEPELLKKAETVSIEVEVESLTDAFENTLSVAETSRAALVKANYQSAAAESSGADLVVMVPQSRARAFLKRVVNLGHLTSEQFEMRQEIANLTVQEPKNGSALSMSKEESRPPATSSKGDASASKGKQLEASPAPALSRAETEARAANAAPPNLKTSGKPSDIIAGRRVITEEPPQMEEAVIRVQIRFTSPSRDNRHPGK